MDNNNKELIVAIENNDIQKVEELIKNGVNINKQDVKFRTPLIKSIQLGRNEIIDLLLKNGAQVNLVERGKVTALHYATHRGDYNIVEKIIDKGAKLNVRDIRGETALHYAMAKGHKKIAMLLIDRGADYNMMDRSGIRVFDLASKEENRDIYDLIMKKEEEKKRKKLNARNIYINKLKRKIESDGNLKEKFSESSIETYVDLKMRNNVNLKQLGYDELNNLLQLYNYNKQEAVKKKNEGPEITEMQIKELAKDIPIYIRGVDRLTGVQKYRKREIRQHNETGGITEIRKLARKEGQETLTKIVGVKTGNYNRCVSMANFGKIIPYLSVGYGIIKDNNQDIHLAANDDLFSEVSKEDDMIYRDDAVTDDRENMPIQQRLDSIFEYLRNESEGDKFNEIIMNVADKDVKFIYWTKKDHLTETGVKEKNIIYDKLQAIYFKRKYYEQTGRVVPIFEYKPNETDYLKETNFDASEIVNMLKTEILDITQKSLKPEYNKGSAIDFLMTFNNEITEIPGAKGIIEKFIQDKTYEYLDKNNIDNVYDVVNLAKYVEMTKGKEYQQEYIKKTFNNILDIDTVMKFLANKTNGAIYTSGRKKGSNKDIALVVEMLSEIREVATDETMEFLKPKLEELVKEIKGKLDLIEIKTAIMNNDIVLINKIIETGIDLNLEDAQGKTPLMYFVETENRYDCENDKNLMIIKMLETAGADINYVSKNGKTVLECAIDRGSNEMVSILLDQGVDLNIRNNDGDTPLMCAVKKADKEKVGLLLEVCNNLNSKNNDGYTLLTFAVSKGYVEIINMLIDKGACIDIIDGRGKSPIMEAIQNCDINLVKLLIKKGADVRDIDKYINLAPKNVNNIKQKEILKILKETKKLQNKQLKNKKSSELKKLTSEQIRDLKKNKQKIQVKIETLIQVKDNAKKLEKSLNNSLFSKGKDKSTPKKQKSNKVKDFGNY